MNGRNSARIVSTAVLGSALLATISCARETPGHCAFANGNATCEEAFAGTFCIFQGPGFLDFAKEEYRNVSEAQRLGCYESRPMTPEGEDMGMELYACVPNGLEDRDGRLDDLRALEAGRKDGKPYDLVTFLGDYGITPQVHASGCRPGSGITTMDASDSGSTTGTDGSTTDGVSSESSESSTTGPMPCMGNEDCPALVAPQCVDGECMTCVEGADGDAACARVDASRPLCVGGTCVQCTPENPAVCDPQLLRCDGATGFCAPCTEHEQCGSGACELEVGRCFPDGITLTVDGTPISEAIAAVPAGGHGVIVVHELEGGSTYQTAGLGLWVDNGKTIALLAAPGELPIIQGTGANPGLRVSGAGTILYMDGLSVSGHTSGRGMLVDLGAYAWVDRSRIVQNSGGGILVQNDAELTLRNCFVGGNEEATVLDVQEATADILYTTLGAGLGVTIGLNCDPAATVTLRNSMIVSRSDDDEILCDGMDASYTATELLLRGTDNVMLGSMQTTWFEDFNAGNFSLTGIQPASVNTAAQWQVGDPLTDIDNQPRPTEDGTLDYAGADVP